MAEVVISGDARLKACPERAAGIHWPGPLDQRLDELCELADEEGADTSRKELVAALVLAAPVNPARLKALVDRYRKAKAREAATTVGGEEKVLRIHRRQPGRRRKRLDISVDAR